MHGSRAERADPEESGGDRSILILPVFHPPIPQTPRRACLFRVRDTTRARGDPHLPRRAYLHYLVRRGCIPTSAGLAGLSGAALPVRQQVDRNGAAERFAAPPMVFSFSLRSFACRHSPTITINRRGRLRLPSPPPAPAIAPSR